MNSKVESMTDKILLDNFDDVPIADPDSDLYGIDPLAEIIAKCIQNISDPIGSVVAVHGRWGSGKSSVINLIEHHLKGNEDRKVIILRFKCWMYQTEEALTLGFFREFYAGLKPSLPKNTKALKKLGQLARHVMAEERLLEAGSLMLGHPGTGTVVGRFFFRFKS
ncbi:MAG: P-loop NTPase fold protein [Aestuariivita sp.]|nr:P-loop NTPase fold protein [Aestuariivita sp.]MCY4201515.1 P-loop NTPase fold protein [Aestuariivita sp.]